MHRRDLLRLLAGSVAAPVALSLGFEELGRAYAQDRRVLVIAAVQDIANFDPHVASGYSAMMFLRNVYDSLVRIEGDPVQVVPHLATSWDVSPDGMEYTFKLDPSAKFHDGTPVTAEAVEYSFKRMLRLNQGYSWMVLNILDETSVRAIDPTTVAIKLINPFAPFLQVLPFIWIANPALVEANQGDDDGQAWLRQNTAASGSFRLKRAELGSVYEFEKVESPWKNGGNLTGAIWRVVRESSQQRSLLLRGEADVALEVSSDDIDELKDKEGIQTIVRTEYRPQRFMMNVKHGPLTDINLRKAVSYAFDYDALLQAAGYGELMHGPLQEGLIGFDPSLAVPRTDLAKAKEYLAKTEWPEGGLTLTASYQTGWEPQRLYTLVLLDSLKKLGITLDVKPMTWADLVGSAKSPETMSDFFAVYVALNYADSDNAAFSGYHSSRNGNWQNPVYGTPEIDKLIEKGRTTVDPEERAAIYKEFQVKVVDDAPAIFGVVESRRLAMTSRVQGFNFTPVSVNAFDCFNISIG